MILIFDHASGPGSSLVRWASYCGVRPGTPQAPLRLGIF